MMICYALINKQKRYASRVQCDRSFVESVMLNHDVLRGMCKIEFGAHPVIFDSLTEVKKIATHKGLRVVTLKKWFTDFIEGKSKQILSEST